MNLLFLKAVPGVARAGEVKNVSDGHARNFLLPRGLAVPATPAALAARSGRVAHVEKATMRARTAHERTIERLRNVRLEYQTKASAQGRLFAGVTAEIISGILRQSDYDVPASAVVLEESIKKVGDHRVGVQFDAHQRAEFILSIVSAS